MTAFVLQQLDYIFFIYGLSFILLGGVCFYIARTNKTPIAWKWLGAFGVLHGVNEWLDLAALSFFDNTFSQALRLAILTASFLCLCEFGRRATRSTPALVDWPWVYVLLLAGATAGGALGAEGLSTTVRYVLGFSGGLWAALVLYRASLMPHQPAKVALIAAAICFALYAVATGVIVPEAPFFPANQINQTVFFKAVGLPIQFFRGILAFGAVACLWWYMTACRAASSETLGPRKASRYMQLLAASIPVVVLLGWLVTNAAGQRVTPEDAAPSFHFIYSPVRTDQPLQVWQREICQNRFVVICATGVLVFLLVGALASVQDFQDQSEQVLASERLYETVVDNSPSCMQLLDRNGRCMAVNPKELEKIGRTEREMLGMHYLDMWPIQTRATVRAAFSKAIGGDRAEFEANYQRSDGRTITWQVVLNPVKDSHGQTHRVVEIATDITDYRHTEAQLRRAKDTAEAATRAKNEFLANISHEIRTPITAVLGYTDLLSEPQVPDDERAAHLGTIRRNAEALLTMVDDILDICKIESGRLGIERVPCSPWQIISDVAAAMQARAASKGLKFTIESEGPIPKTILCDPARLRQILANLICNAVKFTETGEVRAVVSLQANPKREPLLRFEVIDTGIGMGDEQLYRIFQPFTQVDSSAHRQYGGTGLGLTIGKRLAQSLGGDITVSSKRGQGSVFVLTVAAGPLDAAILFEPARKVLAGPGEETPCPRLDCRILLAEDGFDNQRLLSLVLRKAGGEVAIAQNGKEAVEMALGDPAERKSGAAPPFDVILMDIQMPIMDGFEAVRHLRQEGYTGPIIALSAHATTQAAHQCVDAGCDDYLAKPIDREALLRMIAKCLAVARSGSNGAAVAEGSPNPTRELQSPAESHEGESLNS